MSPAPESKSAQPNIQDVFLNYVRREKLIVAIHFSHQQRA
jgi:sRNA-binding regulator protein Hfq